MSTRERAEGVGGDVLSLDALRPLNVTEVAEYTFCERKGAFAAHHIHGDQSSPAFALGTTEHQLRHSVLRQLRGKYANLVSPEDVERFAKSEVLDLVLGASRFVQDLACATHAIYVDEIKYNISAHIEARLLDEEVARAAEYRGLLERGVQPAEGIDRMLPRDIERGVGSTRLRLKGRVDQVWLRDGRSAPVDLKTHGPELRKLFEESHWIQAALYGILLQEAGEQVAEVGLHYTYMGQPEFRALDAELKARALAAIRDARRQLVRGGIPPVPQHEDKCSVCLHHSRCHGPQRVDNLAPLAAPSGVSLVETYSDVVRPEEAAFCDFHRGLSKVLRRGGRASRRDVAQWVKTQRHEILARHGTSNEARISVRRMLKAFEKRAAARLEADPPTHEAYFGGSRVEPSPWPGCIYVVKSDAVVPWVYVGAGARAATDRDVADRCFSAVRDTGLPCNEALRVDHEGHVHTLLFGEEERKQWASRLVSNRNEPRPSRRL